MSKASIVTFVLLFLAANVAAQTNPATTQPAPDQNGSLKSIPGDQLLDQMLKPNGTQAQVLQPLPDKATQDNTSGASAVKPDAPQVNVVREGTNIWDRTARLTHGSNGLRELTFDSDGKVLRDPPMIILPNQKLQQMEDQVSSSSRDLKFQVSGLVTEYRGRNYILIERVVVLADVTQQF